jgi:hypothetical protein
MVRGDAAVNPARPPQLSLNIAIAVSPDLITTDRVFWAPEAGLQVTEYVAAGTLSLSWLLVPLWAPFTENVQLPPTATATSQPLPPPGGGGGGVVGGMDTGAAETIGAGAMGGAEGPVVVGALGPGAAARAAPAPRARASVMT